MSDGTTYLLLPAASEVPFLSKLPSTSNIRDSIYDAVILEEGEVCRIEKRNNGDIESTEA